jgi:ankyrin repeat protein
VNVRGEGGSTDGRTAVYLAAIGGHPEVMQILLREGVDLKGDVGEKCLVGAARNGHAEVVQFLLQAGVDVDSGNEDISGPALIDAAGGWPYRRRANPAERGGRCQWAE